MDELSFNQQFTGKAGADNFAALAKSLEAGAGQPGSTQPSQAAAQFDAEMQRAGLQQQPGSVEPGAVDARAYEYLQKLYVDTAPADRSTQFLQTWERDMGTILAGRKWGESVAAFTARTQSAEPAAQQAADDDGTYVPAAQMTDADRSGYVIPPDLQAYDFDTSALAAARAAGASQQQFEAYCRHLAAKSR